ncbi:MAG: methyltransferase domain-containing protein [Actinomycetota bacterium]
MDETNEAQAEFWAQAGEMWTKLREQFDAQAGDHGTAAIDALAPQPGESIIDIGCGAGSSTIDIAGRVAPGGGVLGFDISPTMIEGARALAEASGASNARFAVGDAMVEPFEPSFDGAYSRFGVMFFSDAVRGFGNIRTALKPGGRLAFVCWQSPMVNEWVSVPLSVMGQHVDLPFGADPTAPGPFSLSDPDRLASVVGDAGFEDVTIEGVELGAFLGETTDEAIDFLFGLMPVAAALRADDPATADVVAAELAERFEPWKTDAGIEAPSATGIVTARSNS